MFDLSRKLTECYAGGMVAKSGISQAGTVYLIHGFLGTGKTTVSNLIAANTGAVRISADEWYIALYGNDFQVGIDVAAEARLRDLLWLHWPTVAAAGADVVLDLGFWPRADRDRGREKCAEIGAECVLFEVVTTVEIALGRCLNRNRSPGSSFVINERTYFALRKGFEPLTPDEPRITVHT